LFVSLCQGLVFILFAKKQYYQAKPKFQLKLSFIFIFTLSQISRGSTEISWGSAQINRGSPKISQGSAQISLGSSGNLIFFIKLIIYR
jgi:hypothetical protein